MNKFIKRSKSLCKAYEAVLVVTVKPDFDVLTGQTYTQFYNETQNRMVKWFNESSFLLRYVINGNKTNYRHRVEVMYLIVVHLLK